MWLIVDKDGKTSLPSNVKVNIKKINAFLKERKEYSLFRRFKHGESNDLLYGILSDFLLWKEISNLYR